MHFTKTVRSIARTLPLLLMSAALLLWLPPHSQAAGKGMVRVMQQNMDAATDLGFITSATDPKSLMIGLVKTIQEVAASKIPRREALLAEEIANLQPDLVALQEATLYRKGPLNQPPATQVMYDQLQSLMDALQQRGLHYAVVAVNNLFDAEVPTPLGFDFRMTDRDAMLARTDLAPSDFALSNVQQGIYQAQWVFGNPVLGSIPVPRGWMTVDVQIGVAAFRFANTHLESPPRALGYSGGAGYGIDADSERGYHAGGPSRRFQRQCRGRAGSLSNDRRDPRSGIRGCLARCASV
jgi:hypothetical protein